MYKDVSDKHDLISGPGIGLFRTCSSSEIYMTVTLQNCSLSAVDQLSMCNDTPQLMIHAGISIQ